MKTLVLLIILVFSCSKEPISKRIPATVKSNNIPYIKKILSLKNKDQLPADVMKKYDPKLIGASIVERINRQSMNKFSGKYFYDFYNDTKLTTFFNPNAIDGILEQKRFMTGYEVSDKIKLGDLINKGFLKENWGYQKEYRLGWENTIAGIKISAVSKNSLKLEHPSHLIRPTYAFIELTKLRKLGKNPEKYPTPIANNALYFGFLGAVLKKEVKARVTWTRNDSGLYDSPLNYVDAKLKEDVRTLKFKSNKPISLSEGNWLEAQIWGGVGLEDIDYFLIPEKLSSKKKKAFAMVIEDEFIDKFMKHDRNKIISKLKQTGIPIYEYTIVNDKKDHYMGDYPDFLSLRRVI